MTDFAQLADTDNTWPKDFSIEANNEGPGFIIPYKVNSGVTRGTQIFAGTIQINNPSTNQQVLSLSGSDGNFVATETSTGLRRVLIGTLPDGTVGIAVSKPGKDVITDGFS